MAEKRNKWRRWERGRGEDGGGIIRGEGGGWGRGRGKGKGKRGEGSGIRFSFWYL